MLDADGHAPAFPFGFGLGYTTIEHALIDHRFDDTGGSAEVRVTQHRRPRRARPSCRSTPPTCLVDAAGGPAAGLPEGDAAGRRRDGRDGRSGCRRRLCSATPAPGEWSPRPGEWAIIAAQHSPISWERRAPAAPDLTSLAERFRPATRQLVVVAQHAAEQAARLPPQRDERVVALQHEVAVAARRTASAGPRAPRPQQRDGAVGRRVDQADERLRAGQVAGDQPSCARREDRLLRPAGHDERSGGTVEQSGRARPPPRTVDRSVCAPPASAAADPARAAPRRSSSRSSTGCCSGRRHPAP